MNNGAGSDSRHSEVAKPVKAKSRNLVRRSMPSTQNPVKALASMAFLLTIASLTPFVAHAQLNSLVSGARRDTSAEKSIISVFIDGSLKTTNDQGSAPAAATGALGVAFRSKNWRFSAQVNIAAKQDTIKNDPGRSILLPGAGGLSSGIIDARLRAFPLPDGSGLLRDFAKRAFFHGYLSASSYNWRLPITDSSAEVAVSANVTGIGLGVSFVVLDGQIGPSNSAFRHQ